MKKILLIIICLYNTVSLEAQVSSGYSLNPKLGLYIDHDAHLGYGAGAEMNYFRNKGLFSVDYYYLKAMDFYISSDEYYCQLGLMTGTHFGHNIFRLQLQGGISAFWGKKKHGKIYVSSWGSENQTKDFIALGLPLKVGLKILPFSFMALGLDIQANLNTQNSVLFPMLSLELGQLRNPIKRKKNPHQQNGRD